MPKCKNADERYRLYDRLFRDTNRPDGYCWEEISETVLNKLDLENFSQQQFNRDIRNMRALFFKNMDVFRKSQVGKKVYYTYSDKRQGIDVNSRTFETISKLSQMEGLGIDDLIDELCETAGVNRTDNSVISYASDKKLEGLEWLLPFYNCIINKKVIEVVFLRDFEKEERYIIHPYHLRRYNGRWFLFGWNPKAEHVYNISFERVIDFKELDIPYEEPECHGLQFGGDNDYYKDVVGVTKYDDKPILTILIRFSDNSFNYVRSKRLHPTQKILKNNEISIEVSPNYELDSLILSFGDNAEVIAPPIYRDHIKKIVKSLADKYKD
jgi:predicted DNA-binding transcriptional regulator YafY